MTIWRICAKYYDNVLYMFFFFPICYAYYPPSASASGLFNKVASVFVLRHDLNIFKRFLHQVFPVGQVSEVASDKSNQLFSYIELHWTTFNFFFSLWKDLCHLAPQIVATISTAAASCAYYKSVASRACWKLLEEVQSVASRVCWKLLEEVKSTALCNVRLFHRSGGAVCKCTWTLLPTPTPTTPQAKRINFPHVVNTTGSVKKLSLELSNTDPLNDKMRTVYNPVNDPPTNLTIAVSHTCFYWENSVFPYSYIFWGFHRIFSHKKPAPSGDNQVPSLRAHALRLRVGDRTQVVPFPGPAMVGFWSCWWGYDWQIMIYNGL